MNHRDYEQVIAALERALAVFELQAVRFGFEQEAYEKLTELKTRVEAARVENTNAGG